eukprot:m.31112 g.31112  ORF g.31112 m.31112 type:complete len:192 (-) comp12034_c0_seq1:50-625(-)
MFEDAPSGFIAAMQLLNKLPQELIAILSHVVLDSIQKPNTPLQLDEVASRLDDDAIFTPVELATMAHAVSHVYQEATRLQADPAQLTAGLRQLGAAVCSTGTVKVLAYVWNERKEQSTKAQTNPVPTLVDWHLALSVSVESKRVKDLSKASVTTALTLSDGRAVNFDMEARQFKALLAALREMDQALAVAS